MATPVAIKFCGLTRLPDIELAVSLGVDYIGLVFADGSPRRIDISLASRLALAARSGSTPPAIVALVRDADTGFIDDVIARVAPDLLQFHGAESEAFCAGFGQRYWKSIGMDGAGDRLAMIEAYPSADAVLLDAHEPGAGGGTGHTFDWTRWPRLDRPLVLAGGLHPGNVAAAIRVTRPYAVDVSSGIESAPGIKDAALMRAFVETVRHSTG